MDKSVDKIKKQALIRGQKVAFAELSGEILLTDRMVSKMKIYPTSFKLYAMGLHTKQLKHIRVFTSKINAFMEYLECEKIRPTEYKLET